MKERGGLKSSAINLSTVSAQIIAQPRGNAIALRPGIPNLIPFD